MGSEGWRMAQQQLDLGTVTLAWTDWVPWAELDSDGQGMTGEWPPRRCGVYEVRRADHDERLTIGKAANLRSRIIGGLIKGRSPHSTGKRIRAEEQNLQDVEIRWAETDRRAAAEEALHRLHIEANGSLPVHTKQT